MVGCLISIRSSRWQIDNCSVITRKGHRQDNAEAAQQKERKELHVDAANERWELNDPVAGAGS